MTSPDPKDRSAQDVKMTPRSVPPQQAKKERKPRTWIRWANIYPPGHFANSESWFMHETEGRARSSVGNRGKTFHVRITELPARQRRRKP